MNFYQYNASSIFIGLIQASEKPEMSTEVPVNAYNVGYYNYFTGNEWVEVMYPVVSKVNFKFALIRANKLAAFNSAANSLTEYEKVYFEDSDGFKRDDTYLINISSQAGLNQQQLDEIFMDCL